MRLNLLEWVRCPACVTHLECRTVARDGAHVMEGLLQCVACRQAYPIQRGVPRFVTTALPGLVRATAEMFGDAWGRSPTLEGYYRQQLQEWLRPLGLEEVRSRSVLDAGCGKGRHTYLLAHAGARVVVGLDLSDAVDIAFDHTKDLPNAHILQADLSRPPFAAGAFDVVISVGVVHHLPTPVQGVARLARCLRERGWLVVWVYGRERTRWIRVLRWGTAVLRPPRVPPTVLWILSFVPTAVLCAGLRVGLPILRRVAPRAIRGLPLAEYLAAICRFPWRELQAIVYDQLAAPVAHYVARDELEQWFWKAGLQEVRLEPVHGMSWTAVGTQPA